ncbi:MAG: sulfatase, partial [bacterium]|nr:sulfatase [bacterium]
AASLRKEGYFTASVIANPFPGRNTGLERGVDHLLEYPVVHRSRREEERATDSGALNRVVLPWLKRHRDHPFFLYVHSTDPHAPYRPPAEEEAKFANPADTAAFDRDYNQLRQTIRAYGGGAVFQRKDARAKGIDPDQWVSRAVDRYDGEAAFNDRNIEQLVDSLRKLGVLDNTLIVVLSDHGEEFLEHGWTTHGHSLYQELTHTVCLMWNPKLIPAPARIAEPVQLIDVMPTVLDLLGVQPTGVVQGQSLTPLIRGESFDRKGAVMASRLAQKASPPPGGGIPENR